ncbi:hypothetical protein SAMN05216526_1783 [Ectothiorhodosinus mongolicus]|uniref:Uncharacterized protein n=1 Tax=Ectothiorhodosinus mongolicus TaxID=233100 RepID=A0A1R3W5T2_9GAMM|nr:hypothetical protein [Ectothiorhodosinus mongolicus]ULX57595.1 hypothetical protein CKX93_07940 [Ectothiorhodosinus mongolicus]SIT73003.1 hypothetical protein SAMN05216526_1783 [Ectothiorhodosinus mongolicus]
MKSRFMAWPARLFALVVASVNLAAAGPLSGFYDFLDTQPTPEAFEEAYPHIWLILPGDFQTREFCTNSYRFFAELDDAGRIVGGDLE